MKMICDHAETCEVYDCLHIKTHKEIAICAQDGCATEETLAKCIPYIDPILLRIQEQFDIWAVLNIKQAGVMEKVSTNLHRIIKEESAR